MDQFLEKHSSELIILIIAALVLGALLVLVPQLLRARRHTADLQHAEQMRALEHGHVLYSPDERSRAAGCAALLGPRAVCVSAGPPTLCRPALQSSRLK